MTLILELPAETEKQLREAAARAGRDVESFVIEAATERLLSLEEADELLGTYSGHANDLTQINLLDCRYRNGQKLIALSDLKRYQHEIETNSDKAMDEMVGLNQLWGLYDE